MRHESLRPSHHMHGNIAAQPNFLMDKLYLVPCERLLSKNSRHLSCIPVRSAPPQAQAGAHETLNLLEAVTNARISAVCGSPPATLRLQLCPPSGQSPLAEAAFEQPPIEPMMLVLGQAIQEDC